MLTSTAKEAPRPFWVVPTMRSPALISAFVLLCCPSSSCAHKIVQRNHRGLPRRSFNKTPEDDSSVELNIALGSSDAGGGAASGGNRTTTFPLCEEHSPLQYDWKALLRTDVYERDTEKAANGGRLTKPEQQLFYLFECEAELRLPLRISKHGAVPYFSLFNVQKLGGIGVGNFFSGDASRLDEKYALYQIAVRWPAEHAFEGCASSADCIELQLLHVGEDLSQAWVSFGFSPAVEPVTPSLLAQLFQINPATGQRTQQGEPEDVLSAELAVDEEIPIGQLDLESLFVPLDDDSDAVPVPRPIGDAERTLIEGVFGADRSRSPAENATATAAVDEEVAAEVLVVNATKTQASAKMAEYFEMPSRSNAARNFGSATGSGLGSLGSSTAGGGSRAGAGFSSLGGASSNFPRKSRCSGSQRKKTNATSSPVRFLEYEDAGRPGVAAPYGRTRWFVRTDTVFPVRTTVFEKIKDFIKQKQADGNARAPFEDPTFFASLLPAPSTGSGAAGSGSSVANAFGSTSTHGSTSLQDTPPLHASLLVKNKIATMAKTKSKTLSKTYRKQSTSTSSSRSSRSYVHIMRSAIWKFNQDAVKRLVHRKNKKTMKRRTSAFGFLDQQHRIQSGLDVDRSSSTTTKTIFSSRRAFSRSATTTTQKNKTTFVDSPPVCRAAKVVAATAARPLIAPAAVVPVSARMQKIGDLLNGVIAENTTGSPSPTTEAAAEVQGATLAEAASSGALSDDEEEALDPLGSQSTTASLTHATAAPSWSRASSSDQGQGATRALPEQQENDMTIDCTSCGPMGIAYRHPDVVSRSKTSRSPSELATHCILVKQAARAAKKLRERTLMLGVKAARCQKVLADNIFEPFAQYAQCHNSRQRILDELASAREAQRVADQEVARTQEDKGVAISRAQDILEHMEAAASRARSTTTAGATSGSATSSTASSASETIEGGGGATGTTTGESSSADIDMDNSPSSVSKSTGESRTSTTSVVTIISPPTVVDEEDKEAAEKEAIAVPALDSLVCPDLEPPRTEMACALKALDPFTRDDAMACAGGVSADAIFRFGDPTVVDDEMDAAYDVE
ncbi:unnamed protein product [Amoebophrya sp. A25]|nr:unnamed protein product [Amoebophrya sp. A25]|eukprot:GSA25T00019210001.1